MAAAKLRCQIKCRWGSAAMPHPALLTARMARSKETIMNIRIARQKGVVAIRLIGDIAVQALACRRRCNWPLQVGSTPNVANTTNASESPLDKAPAVQASAHRSAAGQG